MRGRRLARITDHVLTSSQRSFSPRPACPGPDVRMMRYDGGIRGGGGEAHEVAMSHGGTGAKPVVWSSSAGPPGVPGRRRIRRSQRQASSGQVLRRRIANGRADRHDRPGPASPDATVRARHGGSRSCWPGCCSRWPGTCCPAGRSSSPECWSRCGARPSCSACPNRAAPAVSRRAGQISSGSGPRRRDGGNRDGVIRRRRDAPSARPGTARAGLGAGRGPRPR